MVLEKSDLGLIEFERFILLQEEIAQGEGIILGRKASLIYAEHPLVWTIGRMPKGRLFRKEPINVVKVARGGSITAHFPGQLMMYIIFNIKEFGIGLGQWMQKLEDIVFDSLSDLGIENIERRNRGLWIGDGKLASFGVGAKNWITRFGVGINYEVERIVNDKIYPCGEEGRLLGISEVSNIGKGELKDALEQRVRGFFCSGEEIENVFEGAEYRR